MEIKVHPSVSTTDRRNNVTIRPLGEPFLVKAWVIPDRSSRAEVAGQQEINVYKLGTQADLAGVDLWSRVEWDGAWWDLASPPAKSFGTRHTKHWVMVLRKRPDDGGLDAE